MQEAISRDICVLMILSVIGEACCMSVRRRRRGRCCVIGALVGEVIGVKRGVVLAKQSFAGQKGQPHKEVAKG